MRTIDFKRLRLKGGTIGILLAALMTGPPAPGQAPAGQAPAGQATAAKRRTEVVYWGVSLSPDAKGQDAAIREFERRNPDLKVRILGMGAGRMDPQKLMTSIVGNVAPDVIYQDRFTISDWAARGAFRSLDDLIQRDQADPLCPKKEQYYPGPWNEASYEGKLYAIPHAADNRILYWNKNVFARKANQIRAVGMDPNRAPRTWEEMLLYSKAITEFDAKGNLITAGFMPNFGNSWLYMFAFQNNANFLSPDGRTCTMDTPEAAEALQFVVDGYKIVGGYEKAKKFESGFRGGENDCFLTGQVAMKIDGDWILNNMARYAPNLNFGVAMPPVPAARLAKTGRFASEKDPYVSWVGGFSLAIPAGARHVEEGWRLVKFLMSYEGRMIEARAQANWEKQSGRVFIPRQVAHRFANEAMAREFRPGSQAYADAVNQHVAAAPVARIRPATIVGQFLWSEHASALERACYLKATPKEALATAQANVQRELDAHYQKFKYPIINHRIIGWASLAAFVVVIAYFFFIYRKARLGKLERNEARWGILFVMPWVLGFLLLTLGPMVASLLFSFTQWDVLNEARFVGLKNYSELFGSDKLKVIKSLENAAYLAGIGVPFGLLTGFSVALLLNAAARGIRFYRTAFYLPAIVPTIASSVLWTWVLTADPGKGLLNSYWNSTLTPWLGVSPPGWITSAEWAKPGLILMGIWGAGSGMIFWLAGLKGVPSSLYEAAAIDGATPVKQFWSITFPQMSPLIFFNLLMGFIGGMQEFDRQYVMRPSQDGSVGTDDSMLTPVYHLFNNGFSYFKMGYSSALAWLIFCIVMAITVLQWNLRKKWVFEETSA